MLTLKLEFHVGQQYKGAVENRMFREPSWGNRITSRGKCPKRLPYTLIEVKLKSVVFTFERHSVINSYHISNITSLTQTFLFPLLFLLRKFDKLKLLSVKIW